MKLGKKGSIGFVIGGILVVISSIDQAHDGIIPGQIKLVGGVALILFGLIRFLFAYDNQEEQAKNRKITLLIVSLLIVGAMGYFYLKGSGSKKKEYKKAYGTFEVELNRRRCSGEAILEGEKVTLQIKRIPAGIKIDGFKLYNNDIEIERKSIDMVCALMGDMRVVHCSTGLDLPKNNTEEFVDRDSYTIMYWMREPLEGVKIGDISFTMLTENDNQKRIKIRERK